jgi:DNA end-binding protein Ku
MFRGDGRAEGEMARAFWKGSLSFGLVEIPVSLKPAIRSDSLDFTLLDKADFSPVGYKRYNKSTGREVDWDRIVKGYEYERDEYVVLGDEELRRANVKATQTIDLVEFVDVTEVDTVYFDTPYYVEPVKKGSKSYALLRETLVRTGKAGIGRVVLRTRQHLAALVVRDAVLVLNLLHYVDEIVPAKDLEAPGSLKAAGVSEREIQMAEKLVEGMTGKWDPAKYHDEYREDVLDLVRRKVKSGQTHTIVEPDEAEPKRPRREVVDLMPLLKQSLETHAQKPAARRPARARRTRTAGERRHKKSA